MSADPALRPAPPVTVVTGAGGWLGTALMERLAGEPGALRALAGAPAEVETILAAAPGAQVHVGDIADPEVLGRLLRGAEGADVIHAAGVIHPSDPAEFGRVNAGGTRAVLAAARAAGVRRLVHVSSNSAFGVNPAPDDVFRAEEPFRPYLGYGQAKMEAEILVRAAHGDGIETTVVRPPWFYGPHQPRRQTRFFTAVRTGRFPLVGDGSNRRSMAYVPDLADGVRRAQLAEQAAGRAYWLADRTPYPMRDVLEAVRAALRAEGYAVADGARRLPAAAGRAAEWADRQLQARGRYVQEIHVLGELDKTIACDVSRAEAELGWTPRTELVSGMRAAVRWCRGQGIEL